MPSNKDPSQVLHVQRAARQFAMTVNCDAQVYERRAQLHRPTDPAALAAAVQDLRAQGLSPLDISVALRLNLCAVRSMLLAPGRSGQ